jgi:histidine triad (HIT) family protein
MDNCIFCKIVAGELPSYKVYEDDIFFALLDIFPRTIGHTLVIPKKHYRWTYDVPQFKEYWGVVLEITNAIKNALAPSFVTYVTHGLEVPHAHIHIIPRDNKHTEFVPPIMNLSKKELEPIAQSIRNAFKKS